MYDQQLLPVSGSDAAINSSSGGLSNKVKITAFVIGTLLTLGVAAGNAAACGVRDDGPQPCPEHPLTSFMEEGYDPVWKLTVPLFIFILFILMINKLDRIAAPCAYIQVEFAGVEAVINQIFDQWTVTAFIAMGISCGLHVVAVGFYGYLLTALNAWAAGRLFTRDEPWLAHGCVALGWIGTVAAAAGIMAHFFIGKMLLYGASWPNPQAAAALTLTFCSLMAACLIGGLGAMFYIVST